jgi:cellulose synthase/poly-beta-1,6-N-acetylglucosamine synthase-like glycosyltransferase/peptidoglycan/xylan/chitin deacetylase (PgdA/CDA1 family)
VIFYGSSARRRYYVRAGIALFLALVCAGTFSLWRSVHRAYPAAAVPPPDTSIATTTDKRLVLTFDDGPDPTYTPQVLAILQSKNVPAAFFLIGGNVIRFPNIAKELYDRGFELGNHSYSHSENVQSSNARIERELLSTDKLIEQYTGRRTVFYRPPYLQDIDGLPAEVIGNDAAASGSPALRKINALGFITVGSHVDSNDWQTDRTVAEIANEVLDSVPDGHIILFHDGGGDRSATVAALPYVIDTLESEGYTFVSLSSYLGLTRDEAMPPAPDGTLAARVEHGLVAGAIVAAHRIVPFLLTALIFVSVLRIVVFLPLAALPQPGRSRPWKDGVSVLIPAWNEASNIEGTVRSVARSTLRPRQIIVIDDGSTDATAAIVQTLAGTLEEDLLLVRTENGGKARALNVGLARARYGVVATIDGDSIVAQGALALLAAHFNDPRVGAVGGKVHAAPRKRNLLSRFQDFEYTVGQNVDKRAMGALGAIGIVPGAIGAFRKNDLLTLGGFSTDTMVEDQDLTYALHALGKKVRYEPQARAYTETPGTTRAFLRQRLRWAFGTLQCLWKYRGWFFSLRRPHLGWVLLPYNFIYVAVVPFLWPLIAGLAIALLIFGNWPAVAASVAVFFLLDASYCFFGLLGTPRKLPLIACIPLQRGYYRLIFAIVYVVCGIWILEGTRLYWLTYQRTGSARLYFEREARRYAPFDRLSGP